MANSKATRKRDVEKAYPKKDFMVKLRWLADALERDQPFRKWRASASPCPPIRMNDSGRLTVSSDNALQRGFRAIWHHLCVNFTLPFQQSEYNCFSNEDTHQRSLGWRWQRYLPSEATP